MVMFLIEEGLFERRVKLFQFSAEDDSIISL